MAQRAQFLWEGCACLLQELARADFAEIARIHPLSWTHPTRRRLRPAAPAPDLMVYDLNYAARLESRSLRAAEIVGARGPAV